MKEIKTNNSKYFFMILLAAILIFVFLILKPFMTAIITGGILAYIFHPFYKKINSKLKKDSISALITTLVVIIIIAVPLIFAMNAMAKEAKVNYLLIKQKIMTGDVLPAECYANSTYCQFSRNIKETLSNPQTKYYLDSTTKRITDYIVDSISNFLFSIPKVVLNIFIIFFIMFYLFKDGHLIALKIEKLSPLKDAHYKIILKRFNDTIRAVVIGYLTIGLIEGALGAFGLFVLGVKAPILLGFVIAIFAILPIVGPPIVWLPISILMIIDGNSTGTKSLLIKGIILMLYGTLIIMPIDTILKPKIIGGKANVHPILVLLGVLGGLKMFGFIGMIIGPVLLAVFMTFLKIYEEEKGALFE